MKVLPILATFGSLALGVGCTGEIGDPGQGGGLLTGPLADPGRVTIHRLNRVEYNNTVRDLLGTTLTPGDDFPADDHSYGFDNIADTLSISPIQLELYERAAEALTEDALGLQIASKLDRYEAEIVGGSVGGATADAWNLYSNGDIALVQTLPAQGDYRVAVRAWQDAAGPDPARMTIAVGAATFGPFDVAASAASPLIVEQLLTANAGTVPVTVSFLNDYYDMTTMEDRNLYVDWIEIEGPIGAVSANPLRDRIVTCDFVAEGDPCMRTILGAFAERAFRRPVEATEIDGLMTLVALAEAQGDVADEGLKLAVRAILTSPHFIFRVELDPVPTDKTPHALNAYELASRLSYFLWSSMPDDRLFELARDGTLTEAATLTAEVERMLDDPKSSALVENYGGQWLYTRALTDHVANYSAFPDFDEPLRASMKVEADLFFDELLKGEDVTLPEMLVADFAYVDARLAQHYGLSGVTGVDFTRVTLDDTARGGLLKQGSWLTVTSNPDRTSPVKRGKWVLEHLLCDKPDDPPPGVEGFDPAMVEAKTQRELLAQHRQDPACAVCHESMDNIGLALENYDGIGAFRTVDKGSPIDASGTLEGTDFAGADGLVALLADDPRLASCSVRKMMTYALGRGPVPADNQYVARITDEFRDGGLHLRELIRMVVLSDPFRARRGEPVPEGGGQ